jgi:uncharacterized protein YprB with RNaseH-like and TPR domain
LPDNGDKMLRRFARGFGIEGEVPEEPESTPAGLAVEDTRPGALLQTEHGPVRQIVERRTTGYPYSPCLIEELLIPQTTSHAQYLQDNRLAGFNRDEALFLDTETTGLSHGAGTVAFLVGLGWFEDQEFVMEQLLIDDFDQEQAQLATLLQRLEGKRYLVTYNGKSFDRSVLENRLVIHRFMTAREAHLRLMPHLDLLHVGRRVYRGLLENHRLGTLERELLDYLRIDDISGEMVPQHYFQYMLSGEGRHIDQVLKHNFDDVLSLAHLADHLLTIIDPARLPHDLTIAGNLGKLFAASHHIAPAIQFLEHALATPPIARISSLPRESCPTGRGGTTPPTPTTINGNRGTPRAGSAQPSREPGVPLHPAPPTPDAIKLARLLARLYRKEKRPPADHKALWSNLRNAFPEESAPLVELAKLAEREKELTYALQLTEAALALDPNNEKLRHRRARLVRRLD